MNTTANTLLACMCTWESTDLQHGATLSAYIITALSHKLFTLIIQRLVGLCCVVTMTTMTGCVIWEINNHIYYNEIQGRLLSASKQCPNLCEIPCFHSLYTLYTLYFFIYIVTARKPMRNFYLL